jgi:hypothetical protein
VDIGQLVIGDWELSMPLILIAGGSGSGKSTVGYVLKSRGFPVVDADMDRELSGYVNRKSGLRVNDVPPQPYPKEWMEEHSWQWSMERMQQLAEHHREHCTFLCGGAGDIGKFYSFFKLRFLIWVDGETTAKRLQSREPERWKDDSFELASVLNENKHLRRWAIKEGFTIIIGSLAPELIAEDILAYVDRANLTP